MQTCISYLEQSIYSVHIVVAKYFSLACSGGWRRDGMGGCPYGKIDSLILLPKMNWKLGP